MSAVSMLAKYLPERLKISLDNLDLNVLNSITEIRIRKGNFLVIVVCNKSYFIDEKGKLCDKPFNNCLTVNDDEFEQIFMEMCSYSVYNKTEELKKGFITLECGARVGVASTAIYSNGNVESVKDIDSINIRIPREVRDCADKILNSIYRNSLPSIIVAGKPNSGKTTILRDMARQLSSGFNGEYRKVAVIDERYEFSGNAFGSNLDTGINTDVLSGFSKKEGIEIAIRSLSPEIIICDEISKPEEAESIMYAFSCGVSFALSVHADGIYDLQNKGDVKRLLMSNQFSHIAVLKGYSYVPEIIDINEVLYESGSGNSFNSLNNRDGPCICQ